MHPWLPVVFQGTSQTNHGLSGGCLRKPPWAGNLRPRLNGEILKIMPSGDFANRMNQICLIFKRFLKKIPPSFALCTWRDSDLALAIDRPTRALSWHPTRHWHSCNTCGRHWHSWHPLIHCCPHVLHGVACVHHHLRRRLLQIGS